MSRVILNSLSFILPLSSFTQKSQVNTNTIKSTYIFKITNNFTLENSKSILEIIRLSNQKKLLQQFKKNTNYKLKSWRNLINEQITFLKKTEFNIFNLRKVTDLSLTVFDNTIKKHFRDITVKCKKVKVCTFILNVPLTYQKS